MRCAGRGAIWAGGRPTSSRGDVGCIPDGEYSPVAATWRGTPSYRTYNGRGTESAADVAWRRPAISPACRSCCSPHTSDVYVSLCREYTYDSEAFRAMLPPPDCTHRLGCTPRRGVHGFALDQGRPFGLPHQTVGPSTAGAVPLRRRSTRWSSTTWRPSSPRPPRRTPWGAVSLRGSSATSGPICVAEFWHTDSHEHGVPVAATTSWSRSHAEAGEHVRRVMRAVWSRPPPISSTMSCRRFRCGNGCSPFRSASGPSFTTTPPSPAQCCVSSYAPFALRSEMRAREPVQAPR